MRQPFLNKIALLLALTLALPALAQDDDAPALPDGAIKYSKPKAALYDSLFIFEQDDHSGGGIEVKSKDHRFLHVRVMLNYQLPEDADNVNVDSNQIKLVQGGGKTHPAVGSYDENKIFSSWPDSIWLHSNTRRRNEIVDIVYAIPADATGPYALVIGDLKTLRVEVPKQVTKAPHPADMVDVEVKSVAWGDSVPGESIEVGNKEIKTEFRVPGRRLLAVSLLVHALDYNDRDGTTLSWYSSALTLRDKKGNLYNCHGGFFANRIAHNFGHSAEVGKKSTDAETFFFSPPDDIESFEVLWYGRPVTTYKIKK